ncbi:hypothetical protein [Candidatus Poriferisodalis sp.]
MTDCEPSWICDHRSAAEFLNDPANKLRTMTLPFAGGLELTVRIDEQQ